jgi:hypothetical protein
MFANLEEESEWMGANVVIKQYMHIHNFALF